MKAKFTRETLLMAYPDIRLFTRSEADRFVKRALGLPNDPDIIKEFRREEFGCLKDELVYYRLIDVE